MRRSSHHWVRGASAGSMTGLISRALMSTALTPCRDRTTLLWLACPDRALAGRLYWHEPSSMFVLHFLHGIPISMLPYTFRHVDLLALSRSLCGRSNALTGRDVKRRRRSVGMQPPGIAGTVALRDSQKEVAT